MSFPMITSHSPHRFCVAPMMDWTDRHDRYFLRQISRHARLYTEMITTQAILRGDRARLLVFEAAEHPLALQIGGADPVSMAACARIAEDWGYDEININVGCPSDRVQSGRFGACLMREPNIVADCVTEMRAKVSIPVTVKCRIGVDDQTPEEVLPRFVETIAEAGCETFIVHARKAWLSGLSPAENRDVPPLDYPLVHALKAARPDLTIAINGGIADLDAAMPHLDLVDGVMLGRAAYQTPWVLAEVDRRVFDDTAATPDRWDVAEKMIEYAARRRAEGVPLKSITRHMMGLFHGLPGARSWRRVLGEETRQADASPDLIRRAASMVGTPDQVAA
jgi:tRNA-dihydrouridine synthase A